jgi:hypothetical protein
MLLALFLFKKEKRKKRPTGVGANTLISADCSLRFRMSSFYGKLLKHIVDCSEHLAYVAAGHWILPPKSCHIFSNILTFAYDGTGFVVSK